LVTGGQSGIGAAVTRQLGAENCRVAVLDRVAGDAGEVAVLCDVADEDQVVASVKEVEDHFGGLDLAVLCAGVGGFAPVVEMTSEEWDRVLTINLRGTFLCLREVARAMTRQGLGGAVVVVSSTSGSLVEAGMSHYNVSKAGVNQLVRAAARELGADGIRVNAVAPGATDTPLFAPTRALGGFQERVADRTALGGIGDPEEVARAVVALARLDWVTGQVLATDGGLSLFSPLDPLDTTGAG
jgi:NAD(P)-dependent dehydrogenase (short-subunit alcohol dehydrogenase family)